jgi:inhibitor of cysteine peptidase
VQHTIDHAADGSKLVVRVGDQLELHLAENPTTGYRWLVDESGGQALESGTAEFRRGGSVPGAGGTRVFHFVAAAIGTGVVRLRRVRRPGDPAVDAADRFTLAISVEP